MTMTPLPLNLSGAPPEDDERRCRAENKRGGGRCGRWAVKGARVCVVHGGRSPHIKSKAMSRLMDMQPKAMDKLEEILNNSQNEAVVLKAIEMILTRLGIDHTALLEDSVAMDMFMRNIIQARVDLGKPVPEKFQHYLNEEPDIVEGEIVEDDSPPAEDDEDYGDLL